MTNTVPAGFTPAGTFGRPVRPPTGRTFLDRELTRPIDWRCHQLGEARSPAPRREAGTLTELWPQTWANPSSRAG